MELWEGARLLEAFCQWAGWAEEEWAARRSAPRARPAALGRTLSTWLGWTLARVTLARLGQLARRRRQELECGAAFLALARAALIGMRLARLELTTRHRRRRHALSRLAAAIARRAAARGRARRQAQVAASFWRLRALFCAVARLGGGRTFSVLVRGSPDSPDGPPSAELDEPPHYAPPYESARRALPQPAVAWPSAAGGVAGLPIGSLTTTPRRHLFFGEGSAFPSPPLEVS